MVSYVITGASRGIGLEYVRQLSENPNNTVFALVRSRAKSNFLEPYTERPNVHVVEGDVISIEKMQNAAKEVAAITGGSLDVLIANAAGSIGSNTSLANPSVDLAVVAQELKDNFEINAVSAVITNNVFLPLLRNGKEKKIIDISSALGDTEFTRVTGFAHIAPYAVGKAALNFIVQKYASELASEGFTVLALSPGLVDTSSTKEGPPPTAEQLKGMEAAANLWMKAAPNWDRKPISVQDSVSKQIKVIQGVGQKDSGKLLSQNGNTDWL
jgi:NAD(P)-dependent dehydrogenase (short-subunit alcohol dehydrogenase family)